jgi:hypothetical protein
MQMLHVSDMQVERAMQRAMRLRARNARDMRD